MKFADRKSQKNRSDKIKRRIIPEGNCVKVFTRDIHIRHDIGDGEGEGKDQEKKQFLIIVAFQIELNNCFDEEK